jgi:hypothetical protein
LRSVPGPMRRLCGWILVPQGEGEGYLVEEGLDVIGDEERERKGEIEDEKQIQRMRQMQTQKEDWTPRKRHHFKENGAPIKTQERRELRAFY